MGKYEKPTVLLNEELSEGVYTDSGCFTTSVNIHQSPQSGRGDYRIQINATHSADHTCSWQEVTVYFNQDVEYVSAPGNFVAAGTNYVVFRRENHCNGHDNIGFGDLVVTSDQGLKVDRVVVRDAG